MARPYGKTPKKRSRRARQPEKPETAAFKFRLRGKDNAPLSMREVRQGLMEIARELKAHDDYRAKWVTLYLTMIDEDGNEVLLSPKGERTLYPYKSAADEFGA